jgi:DNA excision repair protein ERCC-2
MLRFPYAPRRYQEEIVDLMDRALEGHHLVLQAGTGSGKTICALYAALRRAREEDRVILYLVRTNSQQRQVMLELRRLGPYGLALQGRQRMCLLAAEDPELSEGSPEELSQFCRDRKGEVHDGKGGCTYYATLMERDLEDVTQWCRQSLPTAEELVERCREFGLCPYELNKLLASEARVITAPYVYFFETPLRRGLLETLERPPEDLILILDEAHNLPDYCREVASFSISTRSVDLAEREVMDYGDPEVADGVSAFDFLEATGRAIRELAAEYVTDEDGFLPPSAFEELLMREFTITTTRLKGMLAALASMGEVVRENRRQRGLLPRSHLLSVARRLLRWITMDSVEYARLILGGEEPALRAYCLDPSLAAAPLLQCHATIHMSGTLEPLVEYRDSMGLPEDTLLRSFPSPFPPERRRVVYADGVTTRYEELTRDPEAVGRLREEVRRLLASCRRNTLFLFPSYGLMELFLDLAGDSRAPVYVERRGMGQGELMRALDSFRRSPSVFFAVVGGRVSEGLDFPDRELEVVVMVGIPYPKPTAAMRALISYYDWKFGKGWEYGVLAPTTRRILQGIGRLIRSEGDRGIAVILDRRAPYFKRALGPMTMAEDPSSAIETHLTMAESLTGR